MITATTTRLGALSLATMLAVSAASASAAGPGRLIEVRSRGCGDCGTVVAIEPFRAPAASGSGVGALAGAVAGGVLGHQLGGGRGRDLATVGGAIAGGFAGNSVEKRVNSRELYDITVRMDRGGTETARTRNISTLHNGSRVHIIGNNIRRM